MTGVGPWILIVGDESTAQRMLDGCMRALGCQVVLAVTGREALGAIERAVVPCVSEPITPADLALPSGHLPAPPHEPAPMREAAGYRQQVNAFRRQVLVTALQRTNGNHTQAAKLLGLHRTYFLRLLQRLNIRAGLDGGAKTPPQEAEAPTPAPSRR